MSLFETKNPFLTDPLDVPVAGSGFINFLQTIVIALAIVVILYLFIITPNEVKGESMRETLQDHDILLTNKLVHIFGGVNSPLYKVFGDYERGDIVTFHLSTTTQEEDLIKRIIAIPGDKVMIQDGIVYVNGNKIAENYLADGTFRNEIIGVSSKTVNNKGKTYLPNTSTLIEGKESIVPPNSYFVMGDNRGNSRDSRYSDIGFVLRKSLKGKVFFRIFPLDKLGILHNPFK